MGSSNIRDIEEAGMKRILVKFPGRRKEPEVILLTPDATTSEILERMGLEGDRYFLSRGAPGSIFGPDEAIYPLVEDGVLLYLVPVVDAD